MIKRPMGLLSLLACLALGELNAAAEGLGIRFRVLSTDPADRLELPRSAVLPVTYIVDEAGTVRQSLVGEQTAEGLLARLEQLRQEN